jgi:ABC-2 type transport system ATP-binding protein
VTADAFGPGTAFEYWERATAAALRTTLALTMLFGRGVVLWLVADGLLCFLFIILTLTGEAPDGLFGLVLCPMYAIGVPILSTVVAAERRDGTLILALVSPAPVAYFFLRAAAIGTFFALQGSILLGFASRGIHSFHLLPAVAYTWVLSGATVSIVVGWAVTLRSPIAVSVASALTVALLAPLTFFDPIFRSEWNAWDAGGWCVPWLSRMGALAAVGAATVIIVVRRLRMPERLLTGRVPLRLAPRCREAEDVPSLSLRNVRKSFGSSPVIQGVTLSARSGVVGLLGANGAGKTTLMRLIVGAISPDVGEVVIGRCKRTTAPGIGFQPQDFHVPRGVTARAYLDYWAIENGLTASQRRRDKVDQVLEIVGLQGEAERLVDEFSGGTRQRVGVARALLGDPDILVLDEPSAGMDVAAREGLRSVLAEYGREHLVLLSTHIASDLEAVADRLLLLDRGQIRFDGRVADFVGSVEGRVWELRVHRNDLAGVRANHEVLSSRLEGGAWVVRVLTEPGTKLSGAEPCAPTLENATIAAIRTTSPAASRALTDLSFLAQVPPPITPILRQSRSRN